MKNETIDLNIINANVLNVFTLEFMNVDVMINNGMIIGFGKCSASVIIDAKEKYLVPGLIDGHMHIESTMLTPIDYSKIALANGVTTVFADCHEIANVLGTTGIDFMLEEIEKSGMDIRLMLPSSVPCSNISGHSNQIVANDLLPYYDNKFVNGLAEVMDFGRIADSDTDYIQKLTDCKKKGLVIDGHMAGLNGDQVDLLRHYSVSTDHECETQKDLVERISRGVNVHIREGSAAKNFTELMKAVTIENHNSVSFCSDDISIVDLVEKGSINNIIKLGIKQGYKPELLLKMASYNAARAYNLTNLGAIASGYIADLVLLNNLEMFEIDQVIKSGTIADGPDFQQSTNITNESLRQTVNININTSNIDLTPKYNIAIGVTNGSLVTDKVELNSDELSYLNKVVVINRYGESKFFSSYIKGINISKGAIASTISHDNHNLVIIGSDDQSIKSIINKVNDSNGGIYTLVDGEFDYCPLEVGGLMTNLSIDETYNNFKRLLNAVDKLGFDELFLAMSFLTLDVIPYLKITDQGLYDFDANELLS